jgi:hypothetical protein
MSSSPLRSLAAPKRASKRARTTGTKAVPPVMKTQSTSFGRTPAAARVSSRQVAIAAVTGAIQRSKSRRSTVTWMLELAVAEVEAGLRSSREQDLGALDGLVQVEGGVGGDDVHQGGDAIGVTGAATQALELAAHPRAAEEGQVMPAGELVIVGAGDLALAAHLDVGVALAERGADQVLEQRGVEVVAGRTDAAGADDVSRARVAVTVGPMRMRQKSVVPAPKSATSASSGRVRVRS